MIPSETDRSCSDKDYYFHGESAAKVQADFEVREQSKSRTVLGK